MDSSATVVILHAADPPPPGHDALDCRPGGHRWARPRTRGSRPYACPLHGTRASRRARLEEHRRRPPVDEEAVPAEDADGRLVHYAYLTATEYARIYRLTVDAVAALKRSVRLWVRPQDIVDELLSRGHRRADAELAGGDAILDSLVRWGTLHRTWDTSDPVRLEDVRRRRFVYFLTHQGATVAEQVNEFLSQVTDNRRLSRVKLAALVEELDALVQQGRLESPDVLTVGNAFDGVLRDFTVLTNNALSFFTEVRVRFERWATDVEAFRAYKQKILDYIRDFLNDLVAHRGEILDALAEIDVYGVERLSAIAAAAEASPFADGADPVASRVAQWSGMCAWMRGGEDSAGSVAALRAEGRRSIHRLVTALERINDARSGRISRKADFVQLARFAFDPAVDPAGLYLRAMGIATWRHLGIADPDAPPAASRSWWETEPNPVTPRMVLGSSGARARSAIATDYSHTKGLLRLRAREERRQVMEAQARFAGRGPMRISDLGDLSLTEFGAFLDLVGAAAARPPDTTVPGRPRRCVSRDGRLRIVLTEPPDGALATLVTPSGVLTGLDLVLDVRDIAVRRDAHGHA